MSNKKKNIMKRVLLTVFVLISIIGASFAQKIISSKGEKSELQGLNYIIVKYDWKNGGRSETTVETTDGLEWSFYDQTARKLKKVFVNYTDLMNYMDKYGWKFLEFVPGSTQVQRILFIRKEAD